MQTLHRNGLLIGAAVLLVIALFTLGRGEKEFQKLPQGVQEIEGTLLKTDISLVRRGTHILTNFGEELYFVESKTIHLGNYEGQEVKVRGILEHNIEAKDLPVLIAQEIEVIGESKNRLFNSSEFALSFELPNGWVAEEKPGRIELIEEAFDSIVALVESEAMTEEDFDAFLATKVSGEPLALSHHQAMRIANEQTGHQIIYVDRGPFVLTILFTPATLEEIELVTDAFESMLSSMRLQSISGVRPPTNGQQSSQPPFPIDGFGQPCGGPAGVLCPAGLTCKIEDFNSGIGKCGRL